MALFNIFSDSVLRARQEQLDGTWNSLNGLSNNCNYPSSSWVEFANDYKNWKEFFDGGNDWSDDSKHATDIWQDKAREWTSKFSGFNCSGVAGHMNNERPGEPFDPNSGIPTVKENPVDEKGIGATLVDLANKPFDVIQNLGLVVGGLIILIIVAVVYMVGKGGASTKGLTISKGG